MSSRTLSSTVKSLAEATFSRSKSAPSTEAAPTTPESVDKDKEVDPTNFKHQRTFDHDRQRAKRSEDYVRMREAKAAVRVWSSVREKRDTSASSPTRKERRINSGASDEDVDVHDVLKGVRGAVAKKEPNAALKPEVKACRLDQAWLHQEISEEQGYVYNDFEVVPAVRPVIVLDELAFMHDTPAPRDLEQEWEHVYHSDGDDSDSSTIISTPTYANIVGRLN
ncbi:hypothetical protein BT96DRAFT_997554 [Gymnopus androsaceus JB14]|uniref:Uncharacterized protein n=1 Tax=Gymnopus androsaceus JB14 TaxID=1447944 RepID=A0A6A4HEJ8_9AGAR|nr:hypothetical protein BT96DRAFT_997554 [Gymnopus androsaceus JB14]